MPKIQIEFQAKNKTCNTIIRDLYIITLFSAIKMKNLFINLRQQKPNLCGEETNHQTHYNGQESGNQSPLYAFGFFVNSHYGG